MKGIFTTNLDKIQYNILISKPWEILHKININQILTKTLSKLCKYVYHREDQITCSIFTFYFFPKLLYIFELFLN